jgi:hypothetical protein
MMSSERKRRLTSELSKELDDRLELLWLLYVTFDQSIPEYEPEFLHVRDRLSAHQVPANAWAPV